MREYKTKNRAQETGVVRKLFSRHRSRRERGFTLLLSALVASIVVALGAAIFTIAQKEVLLSSIGRDSQYAFYAADTGAECALYWDSRHQLFPSDAPVDASLSCDDETASVSGVLSGGSVISSFEFEPNGFCVEVTVQKTIVPNSVQTLIHADGYSTDCDAIVTSPRALQRSVELRY